MTGMWGAQGGIPEWGSRVLVRGVGRACGRASYSCIWGSRRIFLYARQLRRFSCQSPLAEKNFLLCPRNKCLRQAAMPMSRGIPHPEQSPTGSERKRLGAEEEQYACGTFWQPTIPPRHHFGSRSVGRRIMPATQRNAAGLLRLATVYCILDSGRGRP